MYRLYLDYLRPNLLLLQIFLGLFALSFVVSGVFCGKPIMMHTFLLKLNAVLVYALLILSGFLDTTYLVTAILAIYLVGFVEEIAISSLRRGGRRFALHLPPQEAGRAPMSEAAGLLDLQDSRDGGRTGATKDSLLAPFPAPSHSRTRAYRAPPRRWT
jgi:multisubunit Na+/H+ antiporter MnhF subunit